MEFYSIPFLVHTLSILYVHLSYIYRQNFFLVRNIHAFYKYKICGLLGINLAIRIFLSIYNILFNQPIVIILHNNSVYL